jgi:hypothetical protein
MISERNRFLRETAVMKQMLRHTLTDEEKEGLAAECRVSRYSLISTVHFAAYKCTQHHSRFRNPAHHSLDPFDLGKDASRIASARRYEDCRV